MTPLPILPSPTLENSPRFRRNRLGGLVHGVRMLMLLLVLLGLHLLSRRQSSSPGAVPGISVIREYLPEPLRTEELKLEPSGTDPAVLMVAKPGEEPLAYLLQTSPLADSVIGYAGPNNVLLIMDNEQRISQALLLSSRDTVDHVARVVGDEEFWKQFQGWQIGQQPTARVDAVSGATLTSLAIAEAIALRTSGKRSSLRFPKPVSLEESKLFFPECERVEEDPRVPGWFAVIDPSGSRIGSVLRTGELVDAESGYQGPTELLIAMNDVGEVMKVRLRSSFDNEPYVRYAKQEASYWKLFQGKTLPQLASMDLEAAGVEGVSGATMTSLAAARTIAMAADRAQKAMETRAAQPTVSTRKLNWSIGEVATALLAILAVPWSFSRWRGSKLFRMAWHLLVILILVGASGNLLSLALFAGWVRAGIAWRLAPGLAILGAVSLLIPMMLRRNVYCDHMCPHGIAQQWLLPVARARLRRFPTKLPRFFKIGLTILVGLGFLSAISWLLTGIPAQITWLEPFDTYAWRIGISMSLTTFLLSLFLAAFEPMGYCRLACPTGKLLDYTKRTGSSHQWNAIDWTLLLVTIMVWLALWMNANQFPGT